MAIKTRGGICPDGDTIINQESSLAGGGDRDGMYLVTKRGLAIECKCEGLLPISLTPTYAHFAYRSNSIELSVSPGVTVTVHVGCPFWGPALPTNPPPVGVAPLLPGPSGSDRSVHTITRRWVDEIPHLLRNRVRTLWRVPPREPAKGKRRLYNHLHCDRWGDETMSAV